MMLKYFVGFNKTCDNVVREATETNSEVITRQDCARIGITVIFAECTHNNCPKAAEHVINQFGLNIFFELAHQHDMSTLLNLIEYFFLLLYFKDKLPTTPQYEHMLSDYFRNTCFKRVTCALDMCLIILMHLHFSNTRRLLCFNLPAGAGKTWYIQQLAKLNSNITILCPTIQSTEIYTANSIDAHTIHSYFHINFRNPFCASRIYHNNRQKDLVVFDECSMIHMKLVHFILDKEFSQNSTTQIVFIGDFAQVCIT